LAFATAANVGYDRHNPANSSVEPGKRLSKKRTTIMGDRSPKSVQKQAAQKQVKSSAAAEQKKKAVAAKQVAGKK
jgi:hypothetical protein